MKASPVVPPTSDPATNAQTPEARPTSSAVPVLPAVARRQIGRSVPLNLIRRGSMDRPRDALSANPNVR